ncbi:MAG: flagellar hook-basal body complex protein FliE [Alphaproteobacteria bacterium]|jgi:flagellar hook-basal body complex protein FliE|nr:flagellar hook-basal body complex protein FliE [Alphaproteobacteria bacterium]
MKIDNAIGQIANAISAKPASETQEAGKTFGQLVKNAVGETVQAQKTAEAMTGALANGENVPVQEVIDAVNKADITLQTMLSVRDRAVEAYQEIIRMPI